MTGPQSISLLSPSPWPDYELIDSGGFEKLERFGKYVLRRPEPQALWAPSLPVRDWESKTNAWFQKTKGNPESGNWLLHPETPNKWFNTYQRPDLGLQLSYKLSLSSFKHVGIFPEQAANWDFLFQALTSLKAGGQDSPKVLNLFAYTGMASVVAKAAGADVSHLDSIKQVVGWARENMEASRLDGIRWIVDDALKFVHREVRRQKQYQCLILDPPAYGRGPDGEKWILEENLPDLMAGCARLLDPTRFVFVINLYSLGFSALILENLLKQYFPSIKAETGEIHLTDSFGKRLPLGTYGRFTSAP